MTKNLYLTDTYLFKSSASIVEKNQDDKGLYVLLDQTIFYPQGGGQPSDYGILQGNDFELGVISVRQVAHELRHYIDADCDTILEGQDVMCLINADRRILNARYHTAGHLLGNIVEILCPSLQAIKGHSFPKEAYVEFRGSVLPDITKLQDALDKAIDEGHKTKIFEMNPISFEQKFYKLPYQVSEDKVFRIMQIADFSPVPCGGTHLMTTNEIGNMNIGKIKAKNGIVHVSYQIL